MPEEVVSEIQAVNIGYWEQLKHKYAGMVLLGLSTRGAYGKEMDLAAYCHDIATALVEKMKEDQA